ncbi:MAG: MBOAT family O-acyltransferase [Chloroflexota bacterium]
MVFSTYRFIFAFLPVALAGYWLAARLFGRTAAKIWLVMASLYFYAQGSLTFLPLLVGTLVFNYGMMRLLSRQEKGSTGAKLVLTAALLENVGLLLYFKYFNFIIDNINLLLGTALPQRDIPLPLGISFYTFLLIGSVVDLYRDETKASSFLDFAAFVTFFPQLIAGPISHHEDTVPQFSRPGPLSLDSRSVMLAMFLFSLGCAEKILIADPLIAHAQRFYGGTGGTGFYAAWGGVIAYTFAYYFDLSGYANMALALGLLLGIRLPVNFDSPYKALDFADFWRRWNITVSRFFYDYIYRSIFRFGARIGRMMLAVMATFLVSGLWHGVGWHYILWGAVNGIFVCVANLMTLKRWRIPAPLAWAATFFLMMLTRVLFDSASVTQAVTVYKSLLDLRPLVANAGGFLAQGLAYVRGNPGAMLIAIIAAAISFFGPSTRQIIDGFQPKWYHAALAAALLTVSLFRMSGVSTFLYFQF